jgi:hypothetical protein
MKETIYFVNGLQQTTAEHKLMVRDILENAGFIPNDQYKLVRDDGDKELTDHEADEPIHSNERFTAVFSGPTPVSASS